jgi:hypothetical protein
VRVDEVAEVVEEARRPRSVELAGDRARHPALGQRIDVTTAVAQRMESQLPIRGDRARAIRAEQLLEIQSIRQLADRIGQRHERPVGNDRPAPGQQLECVGSAGGARPIMCKLIPSKSHRP